MIQMFQELLFHSDLVFSVQDSDSQQKTEEAGLF